jgi:hypothetical protein
MALAEVLDAPANAALHAFLLYPEILQGQPAELLVKDLQTVVK